MAHASGNTGPAGDPGLTTFLVEHYWPGITAETFLSAAERVRTTAEAMARSGTPIRCLHSTMVPADEAAFCVFDAASADLIEKLYARAGVRFERIVAALEVGWPRSHT
jgi:hypothetical protein